MNICMRLFHGPSIYTSFAAVIAEFANPFRNDLPASAIESQWRLLYDKSLWDKPAPVDNLSFAGLASALAVKLQHPDDPENANIRIGVGTSAEMCSIALGFTDPSASALVLRTSIDLAERIFLGATGEGDCLKQIVPNLQHVKATLRKLLPQTPIVRTLIREARRRAIPVYPVAESSRIWLFGQGAAGFHFFEAASDRDSFTGMQLQRDKILSNRLVKRLGFPGVMHVVTMRKEDALGIAQKLGYPVVVKPIASGKGSGVSAYVVDDAELCIAFAKAAALSPQGVIVERYVVGNDYRLAVFGGRLAWVAVRYPARVVGDGQSSIADLIEAENCQRRQNPAAVGDGLLQLEPDLDMLQHLCKQGFSLDSQPQKDTIVNLRSIANISKGGSIDDVTCSVHPDNVEMAEAIARGFRMDALGVDFMTPDISRSWREVPCAVIEVNGMPGIYFDSRAEKILLAKFPVGSDGRIPSILLIDAPAGVASRVCAQLHGKGRAVGLTSRDYTLFAGHARCQLGDDLQARVLALISDPGCEVLVIEASTRSIEQSGLPLDRFDLVLAFQAIPPKLSSLVQSCCVKFVDAFVSEVDMTPLLDAIIEQYSYLKRL